MPIFGFYTKKEYEARIDAERAYIIACKSQEYACLHSEHVNAMGKMQEKLDAANEEIKQLKEPKTHGGVSAAKGAYKVRMPRKPKAKTK